jgi:predicted hydrocarbon binding protein
LTAKSADAGRPSVARGVRHRVFPVHYGPKQKLFHVIVKLSDAPGSYSLILDTLRPKLNLIGTSTYTLNDGTAIFSGFAEALSKDLTSDEVKRLILGSRGAFDAVVKEGKEGLLIDTFHMGFNVDGDDYLLLRSAGLGQMFDRVSSILGSGGDALLYEEGLSMGHWNAENLIKKIGIDVVKAQVGALSRTLSAQGFGDIDGDVGPDDGAFVMTVKDCFECSDSESRRKGCNFMRGYFVGSAQDIFGKKYRCEESKCVLRGAKLCEFALSPL